MRLLLDTHIALWAIVDDIRLPVMARGLIEGAANEVWVSAASLWEIAIKRALGRGDMPISSADALRYFQASGYGILSISAEHAMGVEGLPGHHQDPFDRLLIAQAMTEPMRLVTHDRHVALYSDTVIFV
ncbi:type II toxin-antitoxin system VapC family toxin [Comamonas badia]|uniref:type II toxin-antitoxin system VapC family toxin n=1 Tax=Comamonas badia TaxID=265291 RepID=UPI0003FAF3A3|nr:type II toxin-antitoxin system VapC family toxin [Comamonas badia]